MPTKTTPAPEGFKRIRNYNGPAKGSAEAKERMARVRAAQYAKNGLQYTSQDKGNEKP